MQRKIYSEETTSNEPLRSDGFIENLALVPKISMVIKSNSFVPSVINSV